MERGIRRIVAIMLMVMVGLSFTGLQAPFVSAAVSAPAKVTLSSVKADGKKAIVKWKSVSGAKGYEVYRKKNDGSYVKMWDTTNLKYSNTKVAYGNKYTYKVRAYKRSNGKKVKGKFSSTKSVTITKPTEAGVTTTESTASLSTWDKLKADYKNDSSAKYLLFVKYTGGSSANIELHSKKSDGSGWKKELSCKGWVGKNGIDKVKEGDKKTPTGTFNVTSGFGIKSKPQTSLPYVKVTKYMYWCGDKTYYNTLVDTSKVKHSCPNGEHLIDYKGAYDYGLFLDYNKDCVYKKGSAIFFHCTTNYAYTGGCISVATENMLKIMSIIDLNTKVCIYPN
ncbi:MAG: L,D-transpeptidase family protein [Firmicutes bacterium]|nr:L,D-transpeptidase family protein [Bacillota bacterium]